MSRLFSGSKTAMRVFPATYQRPSKEHLNEQNILHEHERRHGPSPDAYGPLTVAVGTMGASYGGTGQSFTYQESADFTLNGGIFAVDC
jgi:hypothetical protein